MPSNPQRKVAGKLVAYKPARKQRNPAGKSIKLTLQNYFTSENTAISNSKVGDFLLSPAYFYGRHITHEIPPNPLSPAMKVGKMVDSLICHEPIGLQLKCLKAEDPVLFEEQKTMDPDLITTEDQLYNAKGIANAILSSPVYDWWIKNGTEFQKVLQGNIGGVPVCGLADEYTYVESENTIYIDDTKSSNKHAVASARNWARHCVEFGYFRQFAHYRQMALDALPPKLRKITKVVCRHNVAVKINDYVFKLHTFVIDEAVLRDAYGPFVDAVLRIRDTEIFIDPPVSWDDARLITRRDLPWEDTQDGSEEDPEEFFNE